MTTQQGDKELVLVWFILPNGLARLPWLIKGVGHGLTSGVIYFGPSHYV